MDSATFVTVTLAGVAAVSTVTATATTWRRLRDWTELQTGVASPEPGEKTR